MRFFLSGPMTGFPPHARGWTAVARKLLPRLTVSPARAGMDPQYAGCTEGRRCFPRTRGDGPNTDYAVIDLATFPPHARGWTWIQRGLRKVCGASPARAGMDLHMDPKA